MKTNSLMPVVTDSVASFVERRLPRMNLAERRAALAALQEIIDAEMFKLAASTRENARACPRCGSVSFVKRGRDASGNQRYLCRDCNRSFGGSAHKIFGTTKLDRAVWMRYAECFVDTLSLRAAAARCGVCLKTSFFMRHRLLEALRKHMPSFQVESGCGCELDETFLPESFKGNHSRSDSFKMPRAPRRHAGKGYIGKREWEKRPRGTGSNCICILTGINDANEVFYEIAGRGGLTSERARNLLRGKLADGALISTDRTRVYNRAIAELDSAVHRSFASADHGINRVNNMHSNLKGFLRGFHGVATRRLANYLAWFKWRLSFSHARTPQEMAELVVKQASQGTYETTWRGYKDTPYPFSEYWNDDAAA